MHLTKFNQATHVANRLSLFIKRQIEFRTYLDIVSILALLWSMPWALSIVIMIKYFARVEQPVGIHRALDATHDIDCFWTNLFS